MAEPHVFYRSLAVAPTATGERIGGYAAIFGVTVPIREQGRSFKERIARGAFKRAIGQRDVFALVNHNRDLVLGRTSARTLRLAEDSHGLSFEVDLPETGYARDLRALIARGDVTQCSFGFTAATRDTWDGDVRTLTDVDLIDVSVVSILPGYPKTSVGLRTPPSRLQARGALVQHRLKARAWATLLGADGNPLS